MPSGSYANRARGIKGSNLGTIVDKCRIFDHENQGIGQGEIEASFNEFDRCGQHLRDGSPGTAFFDGAWGAIKTTRAIDVHHNYAHDCRGNGFWLDCTGDRMVGHDNVIEYIEDYGFHYETSWALSAADGQIYRNFIRRIGFRRDNTPYSLDGHKGSGIGVISSKVMDVFDNYVELCEHAHYIADVRAALTIRTTRAATGTCANAMGGQGYALEDISFRNNQSGPLATTARAVHYDTASPGVTNSGNTVGPLEEVPEDPPPDPEDPEGTEVVLMGGGDTAPGRLATHYNSTLPATSPNFPDGPKALGPTQDLLKVVAQHRAQTTVPFYWLNNGDYCYNEADGLITERLWPLLADVGLDDPGCALMTPGNHEYQIGGHPILFRGHRILAYGDFVVNSTHTYTMRNGVTIPARTNPVKGIGAIPRQTEGVHNWDGLNFTIDHDNLTGRHGMWGDIDFGPEVGWVFIGIASNQNDELEPGDAQYHWFKETLENPAYADRKFFVQWHYPCFADAGWLATGNPADQLFELAFDNQVDVMHWGHDHTYERFHRVQPGGGLNPNGPHCFLIGCSGFDKRMGDGSSNQRAKTLDNWLVGKWRLSPLGFRFEAIDQTGVIRDTLYGPDSNGGWVECLR